MGTFKNEIIKETLNPETGEHLILTTTKNFVIKSKSTESFYLTFVSAIHALEKSNLQNNDYKILAKLCTNANYNTSILHLSSKLRLEMAKELGISKTNFNNSLYRLRDQGFITMKMGEIEINPKYFWKGDLSKRFELLKISFDLSAENLIENFENE